MSTTVQAPHSWLTSDYGSYDLLNTARDAIQQLQGNTPTGGQGALDFAKLRQTVTQSLTTATWTSITMDVEDKDLASGHSTSSNTSRYVVQAAGELTCEAGIAFAANATGVRGLRFTVNGAAVAQGRIVLPSCAAGGTEIGLTRTIPCVAGDYIEVQGYQSSGGALSTAYTAPELGSFLNVMWRHL